MQPQSGFWGRPVFSLQIEKIIVTKYYFKQIGSYVFGSKNKKTSLVIWTGKFLIEIWSKVHLGSKLLIRSFLPIFNKLMEYKNGLKMHFA